VESQNPPSTIFSLGDSFFSSPRLALFHLLNLSRQGEDGIGLFSYISNHTRTLFVVQSFFEKRLPVPASYGIHPFVAKKAGQLVRVISPSLLSRLMHRLWDEDRKIKTGESSAEDSLIRIIAGK
jgi:DNA polymerase III delta subunit